MAATEEELEKHLVQKTDYYIVPTFYESPVPVTPANTEEYDEKNWKVLINVLKDLGIKTVLIGGILFKVNPEKSLMFDLKDFYKQRQVAGAKDTGYDLEGCVAGAIGALQKNFKIELSALNFPSRRQELIKIENHKRKY